MTNNFDIKYTIKESEKVYGLEYFMIEKDINYQDRNSKDGLLISIIVPVYNVEIFLPQCLDSLVNQTYSNIEIICVNDGSTDGSLGVLKRYSKIDNRIIIINQKNSGVSKARNNGISYANGIYTMFVDGDDWIECNTCESVLAKIKQTDADVVLYPYIRENVTASLKKNIFASEEIVFADQEVKDELHRRFIGSTKQELAYPESADALCTVWGKLYKTEIIKEKNIQFIDLKKIGTYEDGMFNLLYFQYVYKAVYVNKYFYHYRKTNDISLTSKYRPDLYKQWQNLFSMMAEYIKENHLPHEYKEALYNRIALSILGLGLNIMGSDYGMVTKIKMIHEIIASDRYQKVYRKLDYRYFPIHWKVFFKCARYKCASGIYILLKAINLVR